MDRKKEGEKKSTMDTSTTNLLRLHGNRQLHIDTYDHTSRPFTLFHSSYMHVYQREQKKKSVGQFLRKLVVYSVVISFISSMRFVCVALLHSNYFQQIEHFALNMCRDIITIRLARFLFAFSAHLQHIFYEIFKHYSLFLDRWSSIICFSLHLKCMQIKICIAVCHHSIWVINILSLHFFLKSMI